jgi:hypothetical protein
MQRQLPSGVVFDESLWPLLVIRFSGELSHAQSEEFLSRSASYLRRGERHATILDARLVRDMGLPHKRQRQIGWLEAYESPLRALTIGSAFLLPSPFLQLSLRAFLHIKPLPVPYLVASELHEAVGWAAERFAEEGLTLQARRVREHFVLQRAHAERIAG